MKVFFILFSLVSLSWAQEIDLRKAFDSALLNTETMPIQESKVQQTEEQVSQALSGIFPRLSIVGNYTRIADPGFTGAFVADLNQHSARISATQPLFHGLKEFDALRIAQHSLKSQKFFTQKVKGSLYYQVAKSFFSILAAEQDVRNLKEVLKFSQQRTKELEAWVRSGRSRNTDLLSARSQEAILSAQLDAALNFLDQTRDNFYALTKLDKNSQLKDLSFAEASLTLKSLTDYINLVERRPDVQALEAQVQAARYNKKYVRASYYPSLDLVGNYYLNRSGTNLKNSKWDAGINLSFPFFEGGVTNAQVGEAAAKLHEQELLLAQIRRNAEVEIRVAYTELQKSFNQVKLLKQAVETATAAYQGLSKDYRHGLATNIDVLTAMTKQLEAKRSYDTNRYALEVAKASLDNAVGEFFSLEK